MRTGASRSPRFAAAVGTRNVFRAWAQRAGGLITIARAKEERLRKVVLCIQVDDVRFALKDDDLVMRILGDGLPTSVLKAAGV